MDSEINTPFDPVMGISYTKGSTLSVRFFRVRLERFRLYGLVRMCWVEWWLTIDGVPWRGSPYLANSCVVVGAHPGDAWMDTSGTVFRDRSGQFMYIMVFVLSLRLAEPFAVLIATWARTWSSILMLMLLPVSHPLIYRTIYRTSTEWQAVEALAPEHSVGLRLQELLHYEGIYKWYG